MKIRPFLLLAAAKLAFVNLHAAETRPDRPNILWISIEDASPWFGFAGDTYARTPNLDALAKKSIHYSRAFATAPVCSPSRFAIITGKYATSFGTQRLRSKFPIPESLTGFPAYLRKAGYFTTNNAKTDYNTNAEARIVSESWDQCGDKAHWRNRPNGKPFFSVINLMDSHQVSAFGPVPNKLPPAERHDPATVPVPPYYPDTPGVRQTLAKVHDAMTFTDRKIGDILADLEKDGLADDTIVVFWSDHGQGIPRGKRVLWDSGMHVPHLVYIPQKYRHLAPKPPGSTDDRRVSLMDLGPSMLSLLGLPIPEGLHGRPFLGSAAVEPPQYVFGARDRIDEVLELSRSVRDGRYLYIRNFMPHLSWNQPESFSDKLAMRREITKLAAEGKLDAAQLSYAGPRKDPEQLYDSEADPHQIHNLANDPAHRETLERLRAALRAWQVATGDRGFQHETEQAAGSEYPLDQILDIAWRVGLPGEEAVFIERLKDSNPTVRYWAMLGLRASAGEPAGWRDAATRALDDPSFPVVTEAAGMLVERANDPEALERLRALLESKDANVALHAARTLQLLGEKARPVLPAMYHTLVTLKQPYVTWSLTAAIDELDGQGAATKAVKAAKAQ